MKRSDIPTLEVLKACQASYPRKLTPYQLLIEKFNAPEKVILSAMDRDYGNGLIEYGVCLSCSWVTEKGLGYIERANK